MPRIDDIEDTPNPNAKKFILREPLTWGIARSYENAEQAKDDPLAAALFAVPNVTNVFYVDRWITITQDGGADWRVLSRLVAEPIRAAASADEHSARVTAAAVPALASLRRTRGASTGSTSSSTSASALICRATAGIST